MTGRIIPLPGEAHREAQSLLPWYLAGGLNETERALVEAHVSRCAECQADLRDEPRLAGTIADLRSAPAVLDVEHGWTQMSRAMEREPRRRAPFAARISRLLAKRPGLRLPRAEAPWMRWALAAQFCLVATLSLVLWRTGQPARYHTLGAAPAGAEGSIVVIFRPQTTELDFRTILRSNDARLVDGPTAADAYVLHVSSADRAEVLARLRRQPQVVLAEPLDDGAGR